MNDSKPNKHVSPQRIRGNDSSKCTRERRFKKPINRVPLTRTLFKMFGPSIYSTALFQITRNQRGNPAKALSSVASPEIPSVIRSVSPQLISSPPAAEHPSPSTVTMSNAQARFAGETYGNVYLHRRQTRLPIVARTSSDIPPPVRVCVLSPRDGGHRAPDRERSASTPPPSLVRRRRIWQVITIYITYGNWN